MKEAPVEKRLIDGLQARGFKVLKLTTPGTNGTPDRLVLRPKWSPGPPWVIEIKRPGQTERPLQYHVRMDWLSRGVLVLDPVSNYDQVEELVLELYRICTYSAASNIPCMFCSVPDDCRYGCAAELRLKGII